MQICLRQSAFVHDDFTHSTLKISFFRAIHVVLSYAITLCNKAIQVLGYAMYFRLLLFLGTLSLFEAKAHVFVSLKSPEINMRVGPGKEYPISWVFMKANLPMILVAEFDQWRKVRFYDGTEGWVHKNMISRKNTAVVIKDCAIMYKYSSRSQPIAKIEKNVIVKVIKREDDYVKIDINNMRGWTSKEDIWGADDD